MSSLFTPFQQFFNDNGDPLSGGTLEFYAQGTTNPQNTYSDASLTKPNSNPVVLDGEGRLPNIIFGEGIYKVILREAPSQESPLGVIIDELDPVGGDAGSVVAFSDWISTTIYNKQDIVTGSDGHFYLTISDLNLGNDPTDNPGNNEFWREIRFLGVYNNQVSYDEGEVVQTADGLLWTSVIDNNTGNNPVTDNGSNWIPAVSGGSSSTSTSTFATFENVRTRNNAGMGFAEWGLVDALSVELVNEGIFCDPTISNGGLYLGYAKKGSDIGVSRTKYPVINAAGMEVILKSVGLKASQGNEQSTGFLNEIKLPPAPNGLKAYDRDTSTLTEYSTIAEAFAAETATNKVITSRKDSAFIEVWIENINDRGVVYVGGNVQSGETEYKGITLDKNGIDQSYSAFGEWDSVTHGNNAVWSSLTENEKNLFRNDPQNNIVGDTQARFRVRVIEGRTDNPRIGNSTFTASNIWGETGDDGFTDDYMQPRGKKSGGFNDYADTGSNGLIIDLISTSNRTFAPIGGRNNGESYCGKPPINEPYSGSEEYGVDGLCVCIPIGFVQRRNSGAYAPTFNPNGCVKFVNDKFWYETAQVNMESVEKCFANAQADGNIASGVSGRPDGKYYDAVYASDIKDLRMSTKRLPHKEIREKAKRMAIAGEVRGYDGVPFTQIQTNEWSNGEFNTASIQDTSVCSVGDIVSVERWDSTVYDTTVITEVVNATQLRFRDIVGRKANGYVVIAQTNHGNHSQANPTWTDIIGDPARIAATFPDGVEGQWLPVIPNGTAKDFPLNRKFIQQSPITPRARTDNNGSSWNVSSLSINETTNAWESNNIPSTRVELWSYETQSHFTKGDTNRKALDLGNVFATNDNNISNGNLLLSSLINKVGVGDAEPRNQNVTLINEGGFINGVPNMIAGNEPTHATLTLGATTNPAIKTRSYLSERNNMAMFTLNYKEMFYDGSWGDNDQFEITNNQSTLTDDNGNTVLYGTASFNTQYFIVEE